jgi:uncharacterized protein YceK
MAAEHARCVKGQESNYCTHIKQKQTKPSKSAKTAEINDGIKQWCQALLVDICLFVVPDTILLVCKNKEIQQRNKFFYCLVSLL